MLLVVAHLIGFTGELYVRAKQAGRDELPNEHMEKLILSEKHFFYLQTINRLAHLGHGVRREALLLSTFLSAGGLGKEPRQILAKFGMGMSHGAYVKEKKHLVETARQLCRYVQFLLFSFVYCIRVGATEADRIARSYEA